MSNSSKYYWDNKKKFKCKDTGEEVNGYTKYIQTEHWHKLRNAILERDDYQCQKCGTGFDLVVHHKSYKNVGKEKESQLITLCNKCHTIVHKQTKDAIQASKDIHVFINSLTKKQKEEAFNALKEMFPA